MSHVDIAAVIIVSLAIAATATDISDGDITGGHRAALDQLDRRGIYDTRLKRSPARVFACVCQITSGTHGQ